MAIGVGLVAFALTGLAIFVLVYSRAYSIQHWLDASVDDTARTYHGWGQDLFVQLSAVQARRAALYSRLAIAAAATVVLLLSGSLIFAAAAAVTTYWLPPFAFRVLLQRQMKRFEEQLPDAVDVMVAAVRAGKALPTAIDEAGRRLPAPAGNEFRLIAREHMSGGASIEDALEGASHRLKSETFTMIAAAIGVASREGGDLLKVLERLADAVRALSRLKAKLETETSEVRAQEKVILALTPLFLVGICLYDPSIPDILFRSVVGNLLIVAVIFLQVVGILWIRSIVRSTI